MVAMAAMSGLGLYWGWNQNEEAKKQARKDEAARKKQEQLNVTIAVIGILISAVSVAAMLYYYGR